MKKIIDGKLYNTATAKEIAEYEPFSNSTDFRWWREILYRTKKGQYFIYGEGGALSNYSESGGGSSWGSSTIYLLSDDEAQEWLERYDFVEELEKLFGDKIIVG